MPSLCTASMESRPTAQGLRVRTSLCAAEGHIRHSGLPGHQRRQAASAAICSAAPECCTYNALVFELLQTPGLPSYGLRACL